MGQFKKKGPLIMRITFRAEIYSKTHWLFEVLEDKTISFSDFLSDLQNTEGNKYKMAIKYVPARNR